MWSLSQQWYGDRLSADFSPRTAADSQQLLDRAGLTSAFWKLQP